MSKLPGNTSDSGEVSDSFVASSVVQPRNEYRSARAVAWEVPIDVYGSSVIEDVTGGPPHIEPFREHTDTVIVSPGKGVFPLSTPVSVDQVLLLTNLKSEKNAFCRVINIRKLENDGNCVEVEFTTAVPRFWGVDFESHSLEVLKKTVSGASSVEPSQETYAAPVHKDPPSLAPHKQASNIGIIGQEVSRRSATATVVARSAKRRAWQTWKLLAAAVGFAVVLGSGGFFLGHWFTNDTLDLKAVNALPPLMIATSSKPDHRAAQSVKAEQPAPVPVFRLPDPAFGSSVAEMSKPSVPRNNEALETLPATHPNAADRRPITDFFGSLHAHPVAASRRSVLSRPESAAPVDAIPPASEPIPAQVAPTSPALTPPLLNSTLGNTTQEPRLVFSQTPEYPAAAKLTRMEGDVVIEALIDQSGKVVDASFVSGQKIFREAALKGVRHWRYEPRITSGQPVLSKVVITVKFRL